MVIFVIFFPGMLNSSSIFFYKVNSLGIGTKWSQQDPRNRTIETSGTLWTDEYFQVVMTSQNVRSFRFYLWRQQDPRNRTIETSGTLWTDEYLQVVMTSHNVRSFRFYLRKGGGERFKLILAINTLSIFCEIPITSLVISQQWFRQWLGAVKQQAITWANVYPDLWRHMASLGHNGLI